MSLNLYRRHGSHCVGGRALHETTYEADELRRSWKNCLCPIYASGTLGTGFKRKNTERTTWDDAKAVAHAWENADSWDGSIKLQPALAPVPIAAAAPFAPDGITLER